MRAVFDASVAAKWIFNEPGSEESIQILLKTSSIVEPEFFCIEIESIISKKVRKKEIDRNIAEVKREEMKHLACEYIPYKELSELAFEIATAYSVTLYDAIYVSSAVHSNAIFYTSDVRLYRGLVTTKLSEYVKSIYDTNLTG